MNKTATAWQSLLLTVHAHACCAASWSNLGSSLAFLQQERTEIDLCSGLIGCHGNKTSQSPCM